MPHYIGIELGSTRIKAVAADDAGMPAASGDFEWENRLEDGIWTYALEDAWKGLQQCLASLFSDYKQKTGIPLTDIGGIGISAMMHGYLVFDKDDNQLVPFRTWRNTITEEQAKILTKEFNFNIPQRWSIAHLYRAVMTGEPHVGSINFLTTLAGYIHYKLTGLKAVGVGEASGIFPIDSDTGDYNDKMLGQFDTLVDKYNLPWKIKDILPKVLTAGDNAGYLTEEGAKLIDPSGHLKAGIPLCPPEGDAGTGMVATNSISPGTGNVSAGTSVFAMLVLDKLPKSPHSQIDMITTPAGKPVAMVHCNNCTADLDAWVGIFADASGVIDSSRSAADKGAVYRALYNAALEGDADCGGLVSVNYLSGEHITGFESGRPLLVRTPESRFTVNNLMRSLLYSSMATLKIGMDILTKDDGIKVSKLLAHGGLFKTPVVAQRLLAGALGIPVAVMDSAGEGGAWGIAILAAYSALKNPGETLDEFLSKKIFADAPISTIDPDPKDSEGFDVYLKRFVQVLKVEQAAVEI